MVGGYPRAVQARRRFTGTAGARRDVLRSIVELLQQWITNLDIRFGPELPPPLPVGSIQFLDFRYRHALDTLLRSCQVFGVVEVAQNRRHKVNFLARFKDEMQRVIGFGSVRSQDPRDEAHLASLRVWRGSRREWIGPWIHLIQRTIRVPCDPSFPTRGSAIQESCSRGDFLAVDESPQELAIKRSRNVYPLVRRQGAAGTHKAVADIET